MDIALCAGKSNAKQLQSEKSNQIRLLKIKRKEENKMKKKLVAVLTMVICAAVLACTMTGCGENTSESTYDTKDDINNTSQMASNLAQRQPTPTDVDYSLERYNLIRRTYWVNGQREKANTLVCEIEKPLGYIVLFTESGAVVGSFIVDGKVSSLNSYLTPDSMYYEQGYDSNGTTYGEDNEWLADVDGSYGENDNGIFFFTPDGKYVEWTGTYLYSDIPFEVEQPVIKVGE